MAETILRKDFIGPVGPKGDKGDKGDAGQFVVGRDGRDGRDGKDGHTPRHQWEGSRLRFELATGAWGDWVDLMGPPGQDGLDGADGITPLTPPKGDKGDEGPMGPPGQMVFPKHQWDGTKIRFETAPGEWGAFMDLKGATGPGIQGVHHADLHKNLTILEPVGSDDISFFFTKRKIKIKEIRSVLRGGTSIDWVLKYGPDRSAAGSTVTSVQTTSTSTGDVASLDQDHMPSDCFIWVEVTSSVGVVDELQIFLNYSEV